MDIGSIMFIAVLVIGVLFWGYFFFLAGKEFKEKQIWKKEKSDVIAFALFFIAFTVGSCLWSGAKGDWRYGGIIITTLSVAGFIMWCFTKDRRTDK
jgi:Ca2+/Na+ antiporter